MLAATERPAFAGLTEEEGALLQTIRRVEHASLNHLVDLTGVPADAVRARLARLISLSYVVDGAEPDGYRPTSGPSNT
jgi:hypothetical protein